MEMGTKSPHIGLRDVLLSIRLQCSVRLMKDQTTSLMLPCRIRLSWRDSRLTLTLTVSTPPQNAPILLAPVSKVERHIDSGSRNDFFMQRRDEQNVVHRNLTVCLVFMFFDG